VPATDSGSSPWKHNTYGINLAEGFNENAATLDDELTPEAQNILSKHAENVREHLTDTGVRLLSALALQASLGDCSPHAATMKLRKIAEEEMKEHERDSDAAEWPCAHIIDMAARIHPH